MVQISSISTTGEPVRNAGSQACPSPTELEVLGEAGLDQPSMFLASLPDNSNACSSMSVTLTVERIPILR